MTFLLCHDTDTAQLVIRRKGALQDRVLATRDPAVPLTFREGYSYFNPILKRLELYRLTEGSLLGIFHGITVPKATKQEQVKIDRCWFELAPVKIGRRDLNEDLLRALNNPGNVGVIAQIVRTQLGLRLPQQAPKSKEEWLAWIGDQEQVVPPRVKQFFRNNRPVLFDNPDRTMMLSGEAPPLVHLVRMRWVELAQKIVRQRALHESAEFELLVPDSVFKAGPEAVLKFFEDNLGGTHWHDVNDQYSGLDITEEMTEGPVISGPLFWTRLEHEQHFRPVFLDPSNPIENRPRSVNDIINQIIDPQ